MKLESTKLFLLLSFALFSKELIGTFSHYPSLQQINQLALTKDTLWIASNAGVSIANPWGGFLKHFTAIDGLAETETSAILLSHNFEPFPIGAQGSISRFENGSFKTVHNSYASAGFKLNPGSPIQFGHFFILLFQQRLSFYNSFKNQSALTIDRVQNLSLKDSPPQKIKLRNDSLFLLTNNQIYVIPMHPFDLDSAKHSTGQSVNHADPNQWILFAKDTTNLIAKNFSFTKSGVDFSYSEGFLHTDSSGKRTSIEWTTDQEVLIEDAPILDSSLYFYSDSFFVSIPKTALKISKGQWIIAGIDKVFSVTNSKVKPIYLTYFLPSATIHEVHTFDGEIWIRSFDKIWKKKNNRWIEDFSFPETPINIPYYLDKSLKTMVQNENEDMTISSWGNGLSIYNSNKERVEYFTAENSCLKSSSKEEEFTVVVSGAFQKDTDTFWFLHHPSYDSKNYSLVSWDGSELNCFYDYGSGETPVSLQLNPKNKNELVAVWNGGIDFFNIESGEPELTSNRSIRSMDNILKVNWDSQDRLWVLAEQSLGVICPEQVIENICINQSFQDSLILVNGIFNIDASRLTTLHSDALGDLWVGTLGDGLYHINSRIDSIKGTDIEHFSGKTGLVNDTITSIDSDPSTGNIWIAHPQALTRYHSNAKIIVKKNLSSNKILAFPNPFRFEQHENITFENIPLNASLSLYDESRKRVRHFKQGDIQGGWVLWDTKNQYGKNVRAGVYQWVTEESDLSQSGFLIVLR